MRIETFGLTDRGLRRHHNEDSLLVRDDLGLLIVADGMGGHAAGEVAAELAVREVERVVEAHENSRDDTWPPDWEARLSFDANRLVRAIVAAHRRVTGAVEGNLGLRGMGATVVSGLFDSATNKLTVAHVGDSRAYVFANGVLELLTSDHSWVHEQVVAGLLTEDAARNHPLKNVVTRALGGTQEPVVDIMERDLAVGEWVLLCSDGLNTMLEDQEISDFLARGRGLADSSRELVAAANRKGGLDNITVILAEVCP